MRPCRRSIERAVPALFLAALTVLYPAVAGAHTFLPIADQSIADLSDLIVRGRVVSSRVVTSDGTIYTEYEVEVARFVRGNGSRTVIVRSLGGETDLGDALFVDGSPHFQDGTEVFLFLRQAPSAPGQYQVTEYQLGAFHVTTVDGIEVALREIDLAGDDGTRAPNGERWLGIRDARSFERAMDPRAPQQRSAVGYFRDDADFSDHRYTLFSAGGRNYRWQNLRPRFRIRGRIAGGDGRETAHTKSGVGTWNRSSDLAIQVSSSGGATQGFKRADGISSVIFEDPSNEIAGRFECSRGGTLAVGGVKARGSFGAGGKTFWKVVEGDIVVQDGAGCWTRRNRRNAPALLGHEAGHAIGIGHSTSRAAIMYPSIPSGRSTALHSDDTGALAALKYSDGGGGGGGLKAPSSFRASRVGRTTATLTWRDNSNNETGFEIWWRQKIGRRWGKWYRIGTTGRNARSSRISGMPRRTTQQFGLRAVNRSSASSYVYVTVTTR